MASNSCVLRLPAVPVHVNSIYFSHVLFIPIGCSYNNTRQSTTGFSPFQIHRGRKNEYFGIKDTEKNLSEEVITTEKDILPEPMDGVLAITEAEKRIPDLIPYQTLLKDTSDIYDSIPPNPPPSTNLTSFMDVMTFSQPLDYYAKFMDGEIDAYNRRCVLVGSKINIRANKMLDRFRTKSKKTFNVGSKVRVNLNAHKRSSFAARSFVTKDPKKWMPPTPHWSKEIYVIDKVTNKYGHQMYFVKDLLHEEPLSEPFEYYDLYSCQGIIVGSIVRIDLSINPDYLRSTNAMKLYGKSCVIMFSSLTHFVYRVRAMESITLRGQERDQWRPSATETPVHERGRLQEGEDLVDGEGEQRGHEGGRSRPRQ